MANHVATLQVYGANVYATDKDRGYQQVITAKNLDLNYLSFTVETYGAFW